MTEKSPAEFSGEAKSLSKIATNYQSIILRAQNGKKSAALCAHRFFRAPLALALPSFLKSAARARAPNFESAARSAALFERRSAIVCKVIT